MTTNLTQRLDFLKLQDIIAKKNKQEIEMNVRKLTEAKLIELINSTEDEELLEKLETEYLRRTDATSQEGLLDNFDEMTDAEYEFMKKHWRNS